MAAPVPVAFNLGNPVLSVPSTLMNGVTGYNNFVGGVLASLPPVPQYFFTVPFPNNQAVLYKLSINPLPSSNISGPTEEFIFPLTPSNVTKQSIDLTNYYDVRSSDPNKFGVQRIIDQFGLTPPIITISGTTGFQFHSLDGFQWSGKSSFSRLIFLIQSYATQVIAASNSSPPTQMPIMQFSDGFTGEIYNVVPLSQQAYSMDVSRPIIQTYNIQFLVQSTISGPIAINISQEDPVAQALIETKALLTAGVLTWWTALRNNMPGTLIE